MGRVCEESVNQMHLTLCVSLLLSRVCLVVMSSQLVNLYNGRFEGFQRMLSLCRILVIVLRDVVSVVLRILYVFVLVVEKSIDP